MILNEGLLALLRSRFALLPGVRDRDHRPLVFLSFEYQPANLSVDLLRELIIYFIKISVDETQRNKFAFVVDGRQGSTSTSLKTLLKVLEDDFNGYVGVVYVLKADKFWNKGTSTSSAKYSFEVLTLQLDQLPKFIDAAQLPKELGGRFQYEHNEWMTLRYTAESIEQTIDKNLAQLNEYSKAIRNCSLVHDPSGSSFHVLKEVDDRLKNVKTDIVDQTINELHSKIANSHHQRNPDFLALVPALKQSASRINRARKEVQDLLAAKKHELDRNSQLQTFDQEYSVMSQFISEHIVRAEKLAFAVGKNVDEVKQLHKAHADMIDSVNNVDLTYKQALTVGKRLLDSQPASSHVEKQLKRLAHEWEKLRRLLNERTDLLQLALEFHVRYERYMKQANKWILNVGVDPSTVLGKPVEDLQTAANAHRQFKENYEVVYSEAFGSLAQLQKKAIPHGSGNHSACKFLDDCMREMVRIHKQINNVWESRYLNMDQRIKALLLIPEVDAVVGWLEQHGEPFLLRKFAIGHDFESAVALQHTHEKFVQIAHSTYSNAESLLNTARSLVDSGEIEPETTNQAIADLNARIHSFAKKVDLRTALMYMARNFFMHYREITDHYARLETRDGEVRIVAETLAEAEERKARYHEETVQCEQAYQKVTAEALQLIAKLEEQRELLKVRNETTIENIRAMKEMIEQRHLAEKGRWPAQRECLKQGALLLFYFKRCNVLYNEILQWERDSRELFQRPDIPDRSCGEIARYHGRNIESVKTSVKDALKHADKLKRDVENLGLVMSNRKPAVEAINETATAIHTLEQDVMKWAKSVSERFQSTEGVEKKKRDTANIIAQINHHMDELLQRSCLPRNRADANSLRQDYATFQNQSQILRELVKTYETDTIRCMDSLLNVEYSQILRELLDEVQTLFARYDRTRASREKLVISADDCYYCWENAIPAMETLERKYTTVKANQRQNCEREQNSELLPRRDAHSSRLANLMEEKKKFVNGAMYAQQCADQFLKRLKLFEEENFRNPHASQMLEQCRTLQHEVLRSKREIEQRQQRLTKLWQEVHNDLLICKQACNLELAAKQVIDGIKATAAEFSKAIPRLETLRSASKDDLGPILERVLDYQRSLEMNADIKDLREKWAAFSEESFHSQFVEQAIRQAETQCMKFEANLHEYVQLLGRTLGRKMDDVPKIRSGFLLNQKAPLHQPNRDSNDLTNHADNLKKLRDPMRELLASERDYINDLRRCIEVYLKDYRMEESTLPASLQKKERKIFGNIENLHQFHAEQLISALVGYEHNPEEVGCCFYAYVEQLKEHYTEYILNNEENSAIINHPETVEVFEKIQRRHGLEPNHSLQSMLIKPIQRITRYPMLLSQFMKYTVANQKEMQTALDSMLGIPRAANDRVHLKNFEDADKFRIGNFVMQDTMAVYESKRYFRREKDLQVFLFESNILFAKKEELPSKKIRYVFKFRYLLSDLHVVEHIEGDATKFGLRKGSLPQGDQTVVLKAATNEARKHWVKTLRELVLLMPEKKQSDAESVASLRYNESTVTGSLKSLSIAESQRLSNASFDSTGSTERVGESPQVEENNNPTGAIEMRRPKHLNGVSSKPRFGAEGLEDNHYVLPLTEDGHAYPLLSEMSGTPISMACKRSTVSSTASSDDLPPAMESVSAVMPASMANAPAAPSNGR